MKEFFKDAKFGDKFITEQGEVVTYATRVCITDCEHTQIFGNLCLREPEPLYHIYGSYDVLPRIIYKDNGEVMFKNEYDDSGSNNIQEKI